jgi:hypothetical protein
VSKETYYRGKETYYMGQKRPTIGEKETYYVCSHLLSKNSGTNFLGILPLIINEQQGGVSGDKVRGAIAQPQLTCAWSRFRV